VQYTDDDQSVVMPPPVRRWQRGAWFIPAALAVLLLRVRFFFTPLTPDEGGFLAVGRAWGRGARLYDTIWVDRPQGGLLLFRGLAALGLDHTVGVRLLATAAALVGAAACGCIAARIATRSAAWMTALVAGVLLSVPWYEGFIANGEMLSCSIGAVALACAVRAVWGKGEPSLGWLLVAGVAGGAAVSVKQTAFDALGTAFLLVLAGAVRSGWSRRSRWLAVPALVLGAAVPVLLMVIHAAATGWSRWWYAVVTYRSSNRSVFTNSNWHNLYRSGRFVAVVVLPALVIVITLVLRNRSRAQRNVVVLLALWCALALFAFAAGGQFFRHYWIILIFPFATAVGVLVNGVSGERMRHALLGAALLVPVVSSLIAMVVPSDQAGRRFSDERILGASEEIAHWFDRVAQPGERIFAMCRGGALYGNLSIDPPFPYLWLADVRDAEGASMRLVEWFEGTQRPEYVALFQDASDCDTTGRLQAVLDSGYEQVDAVEGVPLLQRSDR